MKIVKRRSPTDVIALSGAAVGFGTVAVAEFVGDRGEVWAWLAPLAVAWVCAVAGWYLWALQRYRRVLDRRAEALGMLVADAAAGILRDARG